MAQFVQFPRGRHAYEKLIFWTVLAEDEITPRSDRDIVAILHQIGIVRFDEQFQHAGDFVRSALVWARFVAPHLTLFCRPTIGTDEVDGVVAIPHTLATGKTSGAVGKPLKSQVSFR